MEGIVNLADIKVNQLLQGYVVITQYAKLKSSKGSYYINGTMRSGKCSVNFKVWDSVVVNQFEGVAENVVANITGVVTEYKGVMQITVETFVLDNGTVSVDAIIGGINIQKQYTEFLDYINKNLPKEYIGVLQQILQNGEDIEGQNYLNRYFAEYAGQKMHDAMRGGLVHHTLKMLKIFDILVTNDERLESEQHLLRLGIILHDIGKPLEMYNGVYSKYSYVSHRGFGVELLSSVKRLFDGSKETLTLDKYYQLMAIIQGHHGEYGEKPSTVWAILVNKIDELEATCTGLLDKIDDKAQVKVSSTGTQSVYDSTWGYVAF